MIIPHLHFSGCCKEAIALYEKAFGTKAETVITSETMVHPDRRRKIASHMLSCISMGRRYS